MADRLPALQARLLFRVGQLELLKTTPASMPIHAMATLDLPVKTIEAANKICRVFFWKGRRDVHGGHCMVAWHQVCTPKEYGGLGILNLRLLNTALRARWPWLMRTEHDRPWSEFNLQVSPDSLSIYKAATKCNLGNGEVALFWTDWWLEEGRIQDLMPNLFAVIKRRARKQTVRQAVVDGWWQDVSPNMGPQELSEFLQLVDRTHIRLLNVEDKLVWASENNGRYSARSAYRVFFAGRVEANGASQIWWSRAPATCKFFTWLAARERCWTADRLAHRHLPHPIARPFCDQSPETINHILFGCVFARQV
uniref:Reverse transcriptase zinc-binding domain-containing protein n=1 Tax=Triticum urartu TaxID=4572 RepID=A0A8R7V414_TRIUA